MANYAHVVDGVIKNIIIMDPDVYEQSDNELKRNLVEETANTSSICIGGTYDQINNVFKPPQPYPSWSFDLTLKSWVAPVPVPDENTYYIWNETTKEWVNNGPSPNENAS